MALSSGPAKCRVRVQGLYCSTPGSQTPVFWSSCRIRRQGRFTFTTRTPQVIKRRGDGLLLDLSTDQKSKAFLLFPRKLRILLVTDREDGFRLLDPQEPAVRPQIRQYRSWFLNPQARAVRTFPKHYSLSRSQPKAASGTQDGRRVYVGTCRGQSAARLQCSSSHGRKLQVTAENCK